MSPVAGAPPCAELPEHVREDSDGITVKRPTVSPTFYTAEICNARLVN